MTRGTDLVIPLRLVISGEKAREYYDEYVADVEYYRERNDLKPGHPDKGYRTGDPGSYEDYLREYVEGIVDEVATGSRIGTHYVERVES